MNQNFDREIEYQKAKKLKNQLFIDMRSEEEYKKEHIPEAINMPILNDEQRKDIGTLYRKEGELVAKKLAVKYASEKLSEFFEFIEDKSHKNNVILYCSRGGMRSSAIFSLLLGLKVWVYKLSEGYKGYRKYIIDELDLLVDRFEYVTIAGYTGSGKTKILENLENMGCQVLDLEGLANHRGSLLGNVGLGEQPSQKMFESLLYEKLISFEKKTVFVESESGKIGSIHLPKKLHESYTKSEHQVLINSDMEYRISVIKGDYLDKKIGDKISLERKKEIEKSIESLGKYIGKTPAKNLIALLEKGDYDVIISELMQRYYDKIYDIKDREFELIVENNDVRKAAKEIYKKYMEN